MTKCFSDNESYVI